MQEARIEASAAWKDMGDVKDNLDVQVGARGPECHHGRKRLGQPKEAPRCI